MYTCCLVYVSYFCLHQNQSYKYLKLRKYIREGNLWFVPVDAMTVDENGSKGGKKNIKEMSSTCTTVRFCYFVISISLLSRDTRPTQGLKWNKVLKYHHCVCFYSVFRCANCWGTQLPQTCCRYQQNMQKSTSGYMVHRLWLQLIHFLFTLPRKLPRKMWKVMEISYWLGLCNPCLVARLRQEIQETTGNNLLFGQELSLFYSVWYFLSYALDL